MALLAFHLLVPAFQRKSRLRMVESGLVPSLWRMTCLAGSAKTPVVGIILLVASHARRRRSLENIVDMALLAFHLLVLAFQRESRLRMVESGLVPSLRRMTRLASRAQLAVMSIVLPVAAVTTLRRGSQGIQGMHATVARCTTQVGMLAFQGEEGIVVKLLTVSPRAIVTRQTPCTKGFHMRQGKPGIQFTVTTLANQRVEGRDVLAVAVFTRKRRAIAALLVRGQRKAHHLVGKAGSLHHRERRGWPVVLGVTIPTPKARAFHQNPVQAGGI